jgi:hypothetical protein
MIASVTQVLPMKSRYRHADHVDVTDHARHRVWRNMMVAVIGLSAPCWLLLAKRHVDH